MLEGATHGTLLFSGGNFEAISGCRAPFSAPHQKRGLDRAWGQRVDSWVREAVNLYG